MIGTIRIKGLIGDCGDVGKGIMLIDVIKQVKAQPMAEEFDIYINSEGGNVEEGFAIYDYLLGLEQTTRTIGEVKVASIATVIFMAGQTRFLMPDCKFMIHLPAGGVQGNANEIVTYGEMVQEIEALMVDFYSEKFGIDEASMFVLLNAETWLDYQDCIDLGIAIPYRQTLIVARAIFSDTN